MRLLRRSIPSRPLGNPDAHPFDKGSVVGCQLGLFDQPPPPRTCLSIHALPQVFRSGWDSVLKFRKFSTHSICSQCDALRTTIATAWRPQRHDRDTACWPRTAPVNQTNYQTDTQIYVSPKGGSWRTKSRPNSACTLTCAPSTRTGRSTGDYDSELSAGLDMAREKMMGCVGLDIEAAVSVCPNSGCKATSCVASWTGWTKASSCCPAGTGAECLPLNSLAHVCS